MTSDLEFEEIKIEVASCREERLAREGRRKWIKAVIGGGIGTFITAMIFAVRALLAAGATAESARMQTEVVRDTATRVRALETKIAAMTTRLSVLLIRSKGIQINDEE